MLLFGLERREAGLAHFDFDFSRSYLVPDCSGARIILGYTVAGRGTNADGGDSRVGLDAW